MFNYFIQALKDQDADIREIATIILMSAIRKIFILRFSYKLRIKVIFTKLTSKGQIVIPKEIRTFLHLTPGTKFEITIKENEIILHPIPIKKFEKLKVEIPDKVVSQIFRESKKLESNREKRLLNVLGIK